jgi:uncharacterized protein YjiS (DUF1127 family)
MTLNLDPNCTLRMADARGMTVEVLDGCVWITQAGRSEDLILARGGRYRVDGDGVVLVGLDERARVDLRPGERTPTWGWLGRLARAWAQAAEARAAARELEQLPDYRLRDLGISRDQIKLLL